MKPRKLSLSIFVMSACLTGPAAMGQQPPDQQQQQQQQKQQQQGQEQTQKTSMKAKADLHQRIAKAHKNAAKCFKDGKRPESECTDQLSRECESTGASAQCMPKSGGGEMAGAAGGQ